jgi:hypothetical protein
LIAGLDVLESGDGLEAVVDGVAAAALPQYLPVLKPRDYMLDAGPDPAMHTVVVVADDRAGVIATGCGDGVDAAVSAVAVDNTTIEQQLCQGWRATMTSLRLAGSNGRRPRRGDGGRR